VKFLYFCVHLKITQIYNEHEETNPYDDGRIYDAAGDGGQKGPGGKVL
jgi:hypothetical protein